MTKLLKILLWTLGSLLIIVLLAVILIPVLVDPNDYKNEITQQVYKQTGRTLKIEGDIDLSVSLPLSVSLELGKIELSNAEGFTDKPFARMQGASLYVSIWPLVTENRLDVGQIKLDGMELNLAKNQQGVTNWDDLSSVKAPSETTSDEPQQTAPESKEGKAKTAIPQINIAGLKVSNAQVSWTDEQAKQHISLSQTNIIISELIENKPFKLEFSTHINSKNPAINGLFTINSTPTVSLSQQSFQLPGTLLTLDLTGDMLPGGVNKTTLGGDITFDGKAQTFDIKKMKLMTYEMGINGLFHAEKLDSAPQYNGQISIDKFSPRELAATLDAALPKMKEANALSSADAQLTFNGNQNELTISSLEAKLDETSLKGIAAIKNFQTPLYGLDLTLNQLNLDYYAIEASQASAPESAEKTDQAKTPAKKSDKPQSTSIFPLETLRQLNLLGKLSIGQFIAGGAKMSNVLIVLKGEKGVVQLAPLKASLYKGSINLNTSIDARSNTPKLKIVNVLKNVQIGDLLQDTVGSQEFTGAANISANITTAGNFTDQLLKNSNGTGKLLVTDGHIKKLDILTTLRKAQALYRGTKPPTEDQDKNTKFTELKGTFKITDGVIKNNDLASKSPVMEITGKGYADLPKEYLDYSLSIKLLDSLKIDKNTQSTDFAGKIIPYRIKGKFSELSQEANVSKILEQEVKHQIKKELNKELNKGLEKKLGKGFKDLLKF